MKTLPSIAVFLTTFAVNLRRACPSIFCGDSPETVITAVALDISHPPGDALVAVLGKLATVIPLANAAFRMNLLSCALGAAVAALLFVLACRFLESPISRAAAAAAAVGVVTWNPVLVEAMGTAKGAVYLLAVLLLLTAAGEIAARRAVSAGLTLGLLCAHHWMTLAALAPVFAIASILLAARPGIARLRLVLMALFVFIFAGSLFLVLPIRAAQSPPLNWGHVSTLRSLSSHVARKHYLKYEMKRSPESWLRQAKAGAAEIASGTGLGGILLALAGILGLWKIQRPALAFALSAILAPWAISVFYFDLRPDILYLLGIYLLPSQISAAYLAVLGAGLIAVRRPPAGAILSLALIATSLFVQHSKVSLARTSSYTWSHDTARALLSPLPRNAGLILASDLDTFPVWYAQVVEEYRADVEVVNSVLLNHHWYSSRIAGSTGARFSDVGETENPLLLPALLETKRHRWFTSAAPPGNLPPGMKLSPYHLTFAVKRETGLWLPPRGMSLRGFFERIRHLPEPSARMTAGYTLEALRNLASASVLAVNPPD